MKMTIFPLFSLLISRKKVKTHTENRKQKEKQKQEEEDEEENEKQEEERNHLSAGFAPLRFLGAFAWNFSNR